MLPSPAPSSVPSWIVPAGTATRPIWPRSALAALEDGSFTPGEAAEALAKLDELAVQIAELRAAVAAKASR